MNLAAEALELVPRCKVDSYTVYDNECKIERATLEDY